MRLKLCNNLHQRSLGEPISNPGTLDRDHLKDALTIIRQFWLRYRSASISKIDLSPA
jgi:hypothetical protein